MVFIDEHLVVVGETEETSVHACNPSSWRSAECFVASMR